MITAKQARKALASSAKKEPDRVEQALNKIDKEVRKAIKRGESRIVFADGELNSGETEQLRSELRKIGYSFQRESENGLHYELLIW